MVVHVIPDETVKLGTVLENLLHGGTAKVEKTVFETHFFGRFWSVIVGIDGEGSGLVEEFEVVDNEFDGASRNVGVNEFFGACAEFAGGAEDEFVTDGFG